MGRANKNIISHTDSRYYRAIGGDEKLHKKALNVLCGIIEAVSIISDNFYCQYKKTYFLSTSRLFSLDYSSKLVYCAEM